MREMVEDSYLGAIDLVERCMKREWLIGGAYTMRAYSLL